MCRLSTSARSGDRSLSRELGLTTATVHEYVKALYRCFRVSNPAKFSAHFHRKEQADGLRLKGPCAPQGPADAVVTLRRSRPGDDGTADGVIGLTERWPSK